MILTEIIIKKTSMFNLLETHEYMLRRRLPTNYAKTSGYEK